ncbi:beta-ketoacyl-ACP synthase III [Dactylosporangium sp. NPDC049525]|uniref:beta-ketoacyl-ACP synthase III n=1 Tax=Dactylosporangium sp. NPDC049525 TaxID=3154730 RepID=UPI003442A129
MNGTTEIRRVGDRDARAAVLAGLGGYLPPRVVTNAELCETLDTSDEWIRSRIGVSCRHVADGEATVDLAVRAGRCALSAAAAHTVDAVLLVTTSADRLCPAGAPEVASRLGLGPIAAFDIASGCSGFVYGLAAATSLLSCRLVDSVLLIASDVFTTMVDPSDRLSAVIFGDGAGAVVLSAGHPDQAGALAAFDLGSDGTNADLLHVPGGGSRDRKQAGGYSGRSAPYLQMDGRRVFTLAVDGMCRSVGHVLAQVGWTVPDVDAVVAHQANQRILTAVGASLGLDGARVLSNIGQVGNTAAASIPLLMAQAAAAGTLRAGQRVVLTSFGAGLAWGSAALVWPDVRAVVEQF